MILSTYTATKNLELNMYAMSNILNATIAVVQRSECSRPKDYYCFTIVSHTSVADRGHTLL